MINIALIYQKKPITGVVFALALDELYTGSPGYAACMERVGKPKLCIFKTGSSCLRMRVSCFQGYTLIIVITNYVQEMLPFADLKYGRISPTLIPHWKGEAMKA